MRPERHANFEDSNYIKWRNLRLGDTIELKRGYDLPRQARKLGAVPVVSSSGPSGFHSHSKSKAPGVVTGRYGTLGQVFFIAEDFWPLNTTLYVHDFKGNDPKFISYLLRTVDFLSCSDKAAVPGVNRNHLHELRVRIPALPTQRTIATILGTLDDKIELNRRMNQTLEAMAQTLFQSWFVDFDPVRAKAEGRQPEGMDAATAALFPSGFVDNYESLSPVGWASVRMDTIVDVAIGKTPPRNDPQWFSTNPDDVRWLSIKDLGRCMVYALNSSEFLTNETIDKFRIKRISDGTIMLSFKLTVGRVAIADGEMVSNEAIAQLPIKPGGGIGTEYLYCLLRDFDYECLGSTSSIGTAVNSDSIRSITVLHPGPRLSERFTEFSKPLFRKIKENQRQNVTFARLRDTLLPKLLSGEITVRDAETHLAKSA